MSDEPHKPEAKRKTRRKKRAMCKNDLTLPQTAGMKDTSDNHISVRKIFFAPYCKSWFPTDHILSRVEVGDLGAEELKCEILKEDVGVSYQTVIPCDVPTLVLRPWIKVLHEFLKKSKRLPIYTHIALLKIPDRSSAKEVLGVLYFVVRHTLPRDLLGSKKNFHLFMLNVKRIVFGCYNQNIYISSIMRGFKVSEVPWLVNDVPSNASRLFLLSCTVKWLLVWVQHIIRRLWYVTETVPKAGTVFLKKLAWEKLKEAKFKEMVSRKQLCRIPLNHGVVGVCPLRFYLKPKGIRPISCYRFPEEIIPKDIILDAKTLLQQIAGQYGSLNTPTGPRLEEVLLKGLQGILSFYPSKRPAYYFVRVDIKDAYGSINLHQLDCILHEYVKFCIPDIGKVEEVYVSRRVGTVLRKPVKFFRTKNLVLKERENWIINSQRTKTVSVSPMLNVIYSLIYQLAVIDGESFYLVKHGLPQGMVLSAVLCELYYIWMDAYNLESEFQKCPQNELCIRYCDDYLFLSPHRERAEKFLQIMEEGFPNYTCGINKEKTLTNLYDVNACDRRVHFVGYTLNLENFCVEANFNNLTGASIDHTMSFINCKQPGRRLEKRMKIILKMSPLLIQRGLNNKHVSLSNLYQVSLLLAFRFHAFVKVCFSPQRVNQKFLRQCVKIGVRRVTRRACSYLLKDSAGNWITADEIRWLAYRAFEVRLVAVAAHYNKIISWVKRRKCELATNFTAVQVQTLNRVSTPSLPGPFATVK